MRKNIRARVPRALVAYRSLLAVGLRHLLVNRDLQVSYDGKQVSAVLLPSFGDEASGVDHVAVCDVKHIEFDLSEQDGRLLDVLTKKESVTSAVCRALMAARQSNLNP